ncbi:MAG: hypothetical protein IJU98_12415 [Synergistaceae bacterium]|nr:hypothetical protein [Synergistaceae bacterium]
MKKFSAFILSLCAIFVLMSSPVWGEVVPNDSYFDKQWGLKAIRAPEAWEITTGSDNTYVAVIDSGIDYEHGDLAANFNHSQSVSIQSYTASQSF